MSDKKTEYLKRKIKAAREEGNRAEFTKYCQNYLELGGDAEFVSQEKASFIPIERDAANNESINEENIADKDVSVSEKKTDNQTSKIIKIAIPVCVALLVVSVTLISVLIKDGSEVDSDYDKTYSYTESYNNATTYPYDYKAESGYDKSYSDYLPNKNDSVPDDNNSIGSDYVSDNKPSNSTGDNTLANSDVFDNYQDYNSVNDEKYEYINAPDDRNQSVVQDPGTSGTPSSDQSASQESDASNEFTNSQYNNHTHFFSSPTCTQPATCRDCGITKGTVTEHKYSDATCDKPATCRDCGAEQGSALEHTFVSSNSLFCENCGVAGTDIDGLLKNISVLIPEDDLVHISSATVTGYNYRKGLPVYSISVEIKAEYLYTFNGNRITVEAYNKNKSMISSNFIYGGGSEGNTYTYNCSVSVDITETVSEIKIIA